MIFHPWVLLVIFSTSNTLLSYFPLTIQVKLWIGTFGLLVPFLLACWERFKDKNEISFDSSSQSTASSQSLEAAGYPVSKPLNDEFLPAAWLKGGWLFLALALFLRFWQLTTLSVWPLEDEGLFGYIAQRMMEGEPVHWFYLNRAIPSFNFMGLWFFFKAFGISLRTLWLYPAVISSLTLLVFGWATRRLFSKSLSFLFFLGLGLSFWPLFIGRIASVSNLLILWEGLTLGLFALLWAKPQNQSLLFETTRLGLIVGLGFYLSQISWAVVASTLVLAMVYACFFRNKKDVVSFSAFLITAAITFAPLAWQWWHSMDTSFMKDLWVFNRPHGYLLQNFFSKICTFFWGRVPTIVFYYNPFWGGFFNPVLSSFIFLGLLELFRFRSADWVKVFVPSSCILYLPQALSSGEEYMRAIQLLPCLLFLAAVGARRLFVQPPPVNIRAGFLAVVLLGFSLGCDVYHLFGAYHEWWNPVHNPMISGKSLEMQRAYQLFDRVQSQWGTGLILTNLIDNNHDQTLGLATWEFNALENPKASAPRTPWLGILCNVHYQNYLVRHFPGAQCYWLASDVFREDGGMMAGIIPVKPGEQTTLNRWAKAEKAMHLFAEDVMGSGNSHEPLPISRRLEQFYPLFKGDPFLESCYWEKQAVFLSWKRQYGEMASPLLNAIHLGIPAAHLYFRLGKAYLMTGDFDKARRALDQALGFPDNHTMASFLCEHYLNPPRRLSFE